MELKDVAQLFVTATARVEFYWNFYVVMLLALVGWMFASKKPFTTHLKLLITTGYIIFVCMNLIGLWGSYTFAEALREDLLDIAGLKPGDLKNTLASLKPGQLKNTLAILSEHSFLEQRSTALVIHMVLGAVVLLVVWFGRFEDKTSSKAVKSKISTDQNA